MPTRIIYKRRKEKEKRLAQLLLIAAAVLAIGGAGIDDHIAACFTAIGHVDAVQRSELPEFTWRKWYQREEFDWNEVTPVGLKWNDGRSRCDTHLGNMCRASIEQISRMFFEPAMRAAMGTINANGTRVNYLHNDGQDEYWVSRNQGRVSIIHASVIVMARLSTTSSWKTIGGLLGGGHVSQYKLIDILDLWRDHTI
jgi:hypothetical protein